MEAVWQVPQTFCTVSLPGASGRSRGTPALGGGEGGLFCAPTGAPDAASRRPAVQNHLAVITSLVFHSLLEILKLPPSSLENLLGVGVDSVRIYEVRHVTCNPAVERFVQQMERAP